MPQNKHISPILQGQFLLYKAFTLYQGLTNQKNFHLPIGQMKKQFTCPVEKLACPDSFFFSKIKNTLPYTLHSLKFGHRV